MLLAALLLSTQVYLAVPHTDMPKGWPKLQISVVKSDQVFPDECNQEGFQRFSRHVGVGAAACARTNLYTRTCQVVYSTNPLASILTTGVPGLNNLLLKHELMHCEGHDHPFPGMASIQQEYEKFQKAGRPMLTENEREEVQIIMKAHGENSPELFKYVKQNIQAWRLAGMAYDDANPFEPLNADQVLAKQEKGAGTDIKTSAVELEVEKALLEEGFSRTETDEILEINGIK